MLLVAGFETSECAPAVVPGAINSRQSGSVACDRVKVREAVEG